MINVRVELRGSARRKLARMAARGRDLRPAWMRINAVLSRSIDRQFQRSGIPAWEPLAVTTLAGRRRGPGSGQAKPLIDFGLLRDAWSSGTGDGFSQVRPFELVRGVRRRDAPRHQYGGRATGGGYEPPRPVRILSEDVQQAERLILEHVLRDW